MSQRHKKTKTTKINIKAKNAPKLNQMPHKDQTTTPGCPEKQKQYILRSKLDFGCCSSVTKIKQDPNGFKLQNLRPKLQRTYIVPVS